MNPKPLYCPCKEDSPDPCPACGATASGDDPVHGVCQAIRGYRAPEDVQLVLINKKTGEVV